MCIIFLHHALGVGVVDPATGTRNRASPSVPSPPKSAVSSSGSGNGGAKGGRYKLIIASNRDEFLDRPTAPIHFWEDTKSNLLAGRDLVGGGTWLGVNRSGKFATVTNIPSFWDEIVALAEGKTKSTALAAAAAAAAAVAIAASAAAAAGVAANTTQKSQEHENNSHSSSSGSHCLDGSTSAVVVGGSSVLGVGLGWGLLLGLAGVVTVSVGLAVVAAYGAARRSRGGLVADFLKGEEDARTYCLRLSKESWRYAGFNLVLVDPCSAWYLSNKGEVRVAVLPRGSYGIGNASLDTPEPKMVYGKSRVMDVLLRLPAEPRLSEDTLVDLLMDVLADDSPCLPPKQPSLHPLRAWRKCLSRVCIPPTNAPRVLGVGKGWGWGAAMASSAPRKYGTRSSTVVLVDASGRMKVVERNLLISKAGKKGGGGGGGGGDSKEGPAMSTTMHEADQNTFEFCDV